MSIAALLEAAEFLERRDRGLYMNIKPNRHKYVDNIA